MRPNLIENEKHRHGNRQTSKTYPSTVAWAVMYLLVVLIEVTTRRDQLIGGLVLATHEFTLKEVVERSQSTTSSPESGADLGISE
jgi:hypothetical protein